MKNSEDSKVLVVKNSENSKVLVDEMAIIFVWMTLLP